MKRLRDFIIKMLEMLTGVAFVLIVLIGTAGGLTGGIITGFVGFAVSAVIAVLVTGIVYLLISINERLGRLCGEKPRSFAASPPIEKISDGQSS